MYLININKLKISIRSGQFSEAEKFKYLFVFLLMEFAIYKLVSIMARPAPETLDYLSLLLTALLVAVGTYTAYRANGGSAGRDFAARFFAVNLIVTCRFILISLPLYLGWIYYLLKVGSEFNHAGRVFDLLFNLCWGALLYYRIYRHMADLKEPAAAVTN